MIHSSIDKRYRAITDEIRFGLVVSLQYKTYVMKTILTMTRPEICIQNTSSICIKMMDM